VTLAAVACPLQLVIFDCDGVLVDSERLSVRIDVAVLGDLGWRLTEAEVIERFVGRSDEFMVEEIERHLGRRLPLGWEDAYRTLYRDAFASELTPVDGVLEASLTSRSPPAWPPAAVTRASGYAGGLTPAEWL
jgi:beta-phosphoglucomutase-like phosphatase (HAD superfamily)